MKSATTVSIALSTYNGEKFIEEQLDSIFAQTRMPDEIVICDDVSSDETLEKLLAYQQKYPNIVRVHQNEKNLGFIHNFEKAVSLCRGDIIALCDQDDVWFPTKMERILAVFASDPECGFVFSDADVTDEFLKPKGFNVYSRFVRPDLRPGKTLLSYLHKIYLLGCTSAFRAKYLPFLLPVSSNVWGHDHWIGVIMSIISHLRMIDEPLMYYRRHSRNAGNVGAWKRDYALILRQKREGLSTKNYELDFQKWNDMLEHLQTLRKMETPNLPTVALDEGIVAVQARLDFAKARLAIRKRSRLTRLPLVFRLFRNGEYTKYMRGPRTFLMDLIA